MQIAIAANLPLSQAARTTALEQVPYLDPCIRHCRFDDGTIELTLHSRPTDPDGLQQEVLGLLTKISRSFAKTRLQLLSEHAGQPSHTEDPLPDLVASRQVIPAQPGVYSFQGDFLKVLRGLDSFLRSQWLEAGALEQNHPTTLPINSMVSNGYLSGFPHHALLVSTIHRGLSSIEDVAELTTDAGDASRILGNCQADPQQMLAPTVCHHCFESLRGQRISTEGEIYTAVQSCHRNEGTNIEGLTRLQTYTMREIMFYGSPQFVEQGRQQVLDRCREWIDEWGLCSRVATASDPFFAVAKAGKRAYQTLQGLKYELQVYLPHADEWISAASFNNHQGTLVPAYDITLAGEDRLHSACVGVGYERLVYALYSQFGSDFSEWPAAVCKDLLSLA